MHVQYTLKRVGPTETQILNTLNVLFSSFPTPHTEYHHYHQDENHGKCNKYSKDSTHNWTYVIPWKKGDKTRN